LAKRDCKHVRSAAGGVRSIGTRGGLEALLADSPPLWMRNFARVVGFTALVIGFFLIFLIALAVLR
jgi:hypothetical protein